jgi:hypothetical protein
MKDGQMTLFEPPRQRRRSSAEDPAVFEAVLRLRKVGHQVYTAGRAHQVDGRLLSTSQLLATAAALARPKDYSDISAHSDLTPVIAPDPPMTGKPPTGRARTTAVRSWLTSLIMKVT